ncbi:platelet-derived growth factor receptor-like protein [Platysternon megacephalum]|uniref:Platelet-derived growth factor receptor-like protein n=1 Tax=Platysternon megacephalum TaxID=55544 RepID=A0A4D9FCI1_9SAUR|nr:platelet-derived growth factor receptor-like protein [Platysternon megacephalum]
MLGLFHKLWSKLPQGPEESSLSFPLKKKKKICHGYKANLQNMSCVMNGANLKRRNFFLRCQLLHFNGCRCLMMLLTHSISLLKAFKKGGEVYEELHQDSPKWGFKSWERPTHLNLYNTECRGDEIFLKRVWFSKCIHLF